MVRFGRGANGRVGAPRLNPDGAPSLSGMKYSMQLAKCTRFVFEGTGTRGDVAPLLAIARQMVSRGYEGHLLANEVFGDEARAQGVSFWPITKLSGVFQGRERNQWENHLFVGLERTLAYFQRHGLERTVVVNLDRLSASNLVSEKHGLPTWRLHLAPFKLRSLLAPPWPFRAKTQGRLGELYRRQVLPKVYHAYETDQRVLSFVNQQRKSLGLRPIRSTNFVEPHVSRQVALFPRWYCEPAPDWPSDLEFAGFPLPAATGSLPDWLLDFLDREGKPIVFTPGTGLGNVADFFERARHCCEALGMPGLCLSPAATTAGLRVTSRFVHAPFVELGLLLGRAALLVHHGGIGTAARALQAGVAQIVCPRGFDQPDNGHRVMDLQAGTVLERGDLSVESLTHAAHELLHFEAVRSRLRAIKTHWEFRNGASWCADMLEQYATRPAPVRHSCPVSGGNGYDSGRPESRDWEGPLSVPQNAHGEPIGRVEVL